MESGTVDPSLRIFLTPSFCLIRWTQLHPLLRLKESGIHRSGFFRHLTFVLGHFKVLIRLTLLRRRIKVSRHELVFRLCLSAEDFVLFVLLVSDDP